MNQVARPHADAHNRVWSLPPMSGLAWKLSLVVLIALLVVASTLAMRARQHTDPAPLALGLSGPPDGLIRMKRTAANVAELETLRTAIGAFVDQEGRLPATLRELSDSGYLSHRNTGEWLAQIEYNPQNGAVKRRAD